MAKYIQEIEDGKVVEYMVINKDEQKKLTELAQKNVKSDCSCSLSYSQFLKILEENGIVIHKSNMK